MSGIVDQILDLYRAGGGAAYFGEAVTQAEHALQAAALAEAAGASAEVVTAALLHDIGHLLHGRGEDVADAGVDARHEVVGAAFLAQHFVTDVVAAVSLHVDAKRYLCATEPGYFARLSPASVKSLGLQGGPMDKAAVQAFAAKTAAAAALAVRRWDEEAKVPGLPTPGLDHFRGHLTTALRRP